SDLQTATSLAMTYISNLGMGPTLLAIPNSPMGGVPMPVLKTADELLRQLFEETKRLVREKDFVVHAVANALLEREELIGSELDDVFRYAELSHPDGAKAFERRPLVLSWPFVQMGAVVHIAYPADETAEVA